MAFKPEDVEDVVPNSAGGIPCGLAVENYIPDRQSTNRLGDGGIVLKQSVAGIQLDVAPVVECKHPYPIELSLENPLRPGEPLLRQGRRHRRHPLGEGRVFLDWHGSNSCMSNRW